MEVYRNAPVSLSEMEWAKLGTSILASHHNNNTIPRAEVIQLLHAMTKFAEQNARVTSISLAPSSNAVFADEPLVGSFTQLSILTPRMKCPTLQIHSTFMRILARQSIDVGFASITRVLALPLANGEYALALSLSQPIFIGKSKYDTLVISFEKKRIVEFNLDLTKLLPLVGGGDSLSTGAQPSKLVTLLSQIKAASLGVEVIGKTMAAFAGHSIEACGVKASGISGGSGIACRIKVNTGLLFMFGGGLFFMTTPTFFIPVDDITKLQVSDSGYTRDFQFIIHTADKEWAFEGIDKSNQQIVQDWVRSRERERRNALAAELAAARSEADLASATISIDHTLSTSTNISSAVLGCSAGDDIAIGVDNSRPGKRVVSAADYNLSDDSEDEGDSDYEPVARTEVDEEYDSGIEQVDYDSDASSGIGSCSEEGGGDDVDGSEDGFDSDENADKAANTVMNHSNNDCGVSPTRLKHKHHHKSVEGSSSKKQKLINGQEHHDSHKHRHACPTTELCTTVNTSATGCSDAMLRTLANTPIKPISQTATFKSENSINTDGVYAGCNTVSMLKSESVATTVKPEASQPMRSLLSTLPLTGVCASPLSIQINTQTIPIIQSFSAMKPKADAKVMNLQATDIIDLCE